MKITPYVNEESLKGDFNQTTIWQEVSDGVPEPAIQLRTYDGESAPLIEIRQGKSTVLINGETVPELCRALRSLAKSG